METFISDWWRRSRQSLACKGLRTFRFCVVSWKNEREPPNQILSEKKSWLDSKVHHNTELWTQLMVSQWNSSGIFSQDSPHCSFTTKSKSSCQRWAYNQKISLDGLSSCRCLTVSHGDFKKIRKNANQALNSFRFMQKIFTKKMVIRRTWIRKEVVFYSWM